MMAKPPRLPELTAHDAGRRFVMRPGTQRVLVVTADTDEAQHEPQAEGPVRVTERSADQDVGRVRRFVIEATGSGSATVRLGQAWWGFEISGAAQRPEQTRDDTDEGWGERRSGHSRTWWEEQRPPHW